MDAPPPPHPCMLIGASPALGILSIGTRWPRAVEVGALSGGDARPRTPAACRPIVGAGTAGSAVGRQRGRAGVQLPPPWPALCESLERKERRRPLSNPSVGRAPRRAERDWLTHRAHVPLARRGQGRHRRLARRLRAVPHARPVAGVAGRTAPARPQPRAHDPAARLARRAPPVVCCVQWRVDLPRCHLRRVFLSHGGRAGGPVLLRRPPRRSAARKVALRAAKGAPLPPTARDPPRRQ